MNQTYTTRVWVLCLLLGLCSLSLYAQVPPQTTLPAREAVDEPNGAPSAQRQGDLVTPGAYPPPSNDDCASATVLTVGAACISGTTNTATVQGGEYLCISPGGGISPETVWYRFTATSTSMVLGVVLTNSTNCATVLAVYGPFAPGTGCLPSAGNQILCQNMGLIDPGFHPNLTGLVVGQSYLVQVQGNNCGGGNDRFANFCISIQPPASNVSASTASVISNCGTAFVGTTAGGHFANGTSTGANNLDNNAGTTVGGASEAGDDVTFVINNVSWFSFCNGNASSCNWSVNLNGISGCLLSSLNAGVQAAVFTGTPAALTNVASSPSRVAPGSSWASGTFAVAAGGCAYIAVDGFAGDECTYNLTLTNVSCPCTVVPIELAFFSGRNLSSQIDLEWEMGAVDGLGHFFIERSADARTFMPFLDQIPPSTLPSHRYQVSDMAPMAGWNYYRLGAIDIEGNTSYLNTVAVYRQQGADLELWASSASTSIDLFANSPIAGEAQLTITDLQGRVVRSLPWSLHVGQNKIACNGLGLSTGMYLAKVSLGGKVATRKFGL